MTDDRSRINQKLVETKEQWARDGRQPRGGPPHERLPPGQHEVQDWPVLDLGIVPKFEPASWSLTIDGLVTAPQHWSWAEFLAQPQSEDTSDMHCVTSWSRFNNHWQGVSSAHILKLAQPRPEVRHVLCHSADGYSTNIRLDVFADRDVLLAHSWEGKALAPDHGGPVRVIVPKFYLWKSAKWVTRLEFLAEDKPGYWEVRGYHNVGDPWTEERYS